MFTAAPLTTAKTWKQPKCPLTDDWIKKMWYIHIMEYYSAIKKNDIIPFAATWMELETLILSEVNQKEKAKYHSIIYIWNLIYSTNEPVYRKETGVPVVAQWLTNPTRNHEVAGLIPALALA